MHIAVNQETVNDSAKLIMHRLISRAIARDPSLIGRAKASNARAAECYAGRSFVREWDELLDLPPMELRTRLTSREPLMVRLRTSSPFLLDAGIDFTDYKFRLRIRRAARRTVERRLASATRRPAAVG